MKEIVARGKESFGSTAFRIHLAVTLFIAFALAFLIFRLWFKQPYLGILSGGKLFALLLVVDFFCGPFLTLITHNKKKSSKERAMDLVVIGCIQVAALSYGVYSTALARPVALVLEVDRFHLVTYSDIDPGEIAMTPPWARPPSFAEVKILSIRSPKSNEERATLLELALQGVEPAQKPSWWQSYEAGRSQAIRGAGSVEDLLKNNPQKKEAITTESLKSANNPQAGETSIAQDLRWLPILSRKNTNWVAFIDPSTARIRGFVEL